MTEAQINDYKASGHKTPHRLLHDALSKEDYARVLVNMRKERMNAHVRVWFIKSENACDALCSAFSFTRSNEGIDYWADVIEAINHD